MSMSVPKDANMIPLPKSYTTNGDSVKIVPTVSACENVPEFLKTAAAVFSEYAFRLYGLSLQKCNNGFICFDYDPSLEDEEYRIISSADGVTVFSSTISGASHGASALLQLMEKSAGEICMPACTICDKPDISWRGLMIDLARGDYPVYDILTYADICYFYRLSVLHLHFADSGAYTLPSEHFPKLNTGRRNYSKYEIDYISQYLEDRGILLIPEIEMPAHTDVLVKKHPDVFGSAHKGLICPGHIGALDGLDTLIGEVCELFPNAPYIHIGCDEANYSGWDDCPLCLRLMEENNIPSSRALYTWIVDKTTRMVLAHGRKPIVWEGFPEDGTEMLSRDITVMIFQSTYQNVNALEKAGFHVVNTSWQPLYVVPSRPKYYSPEGIYRWNTYRWLYEDAVNDADPIDAKIPEMVLGAQLCVWESTDFQTDGDIVCVNLPTMAERTWNNIPILTFDEYKKCADNILTKLTPAIQNRASLF